MPYGGWGPPAIDPGTISGLLDPYIAKQKEQALGSATSAAAAALAKGDYAGMAKMLQSIAGENPQLAGMLMTQMHGAQQLKQQQAQFEENKAFQHEQLNKPTIHVLQTDEGPVAFKYNPADGTMTNVTPQEYMPGASVGRAVGGVPATPGAPGATSTPAPPPAPPVEPPAVTTPLPLAAAGDTTPLAGDIAHLQENPSLAPKFAKRFPGTDPAAILAQAPAPTPAPATAPVPAPAAAAPAQPAFITNPPPGILPGAWRKATTQEMAKKIADQYAAQIDAVRTIAPFEAPLKRATAAYAALAKLGAIGPFQGSGPAQMAGKYLAPHGTQYGRIAELQNAFNAAIGELQLFQAQTKMKGQGAITDFERRLIGGTLPSLDMKDPQAGLNILGELQASFDRTKAMARVGPQLGRP